MILEFVALGVGEKLETHTPLALADLDVDEY